MENFIYWLYNNFVSLIMTLSNLTADLIKYAFENAFSGLDTLNDMTFNLTLFSDIPIITTNVYDVLLLTFSIFYTIMFVVIVYKIIKKVIVKITGWNKW